MRRLQSTVKTTWRLVVPLVLLLSMLGHGRSAQAQDTPRCFSETGFCISGRFRAYWEQNGGLAVFGFPISAPRDELNRDTGKTYRTQWFERTRFELHPENAAPYDVLLGRIGDDRLRQIAGSWLDMPAEPGPKSGCLWFEASHHNICNQADGAGFMTYWLTHGLQDPLLDAYGRSLALFGLPLTEPRVETNTSGDVVLTQWFERARFEWHPNNPAEFKVLLGLVASEVREGACARTPAPVNGQLRPGNCVAQGTRVTMDASGFQQRELVDFWLVGPNGQTVGAKQTLTASTSGTISGLPFDTSAATPGLWAWTFQGRASGRGARLAVRILPRG